MRERLDAITDVEGVAVGHSEAGLTAILPYPRSVARRKVWGGFAASGSVGDVTGLHVLRDFGTLSSPIVIAPLSWLGAVYYLLIADGFRRDKDLPIDAGWPPLVVGVSSPADPAPSQPPPPGAVSAMLDASGRRFATGRAGAGARWAQGVPPGGIGTCSLSTPGGSLLGALAGVSAAACVIVLATDAPLDPRGLALVAERAVRETVAGAAPRPEPAAAVVAFSTSQPVDDAFSEGKDKVSRRSAPAAELAALGAAAARASFEACARARRGEPRS